VTELGGEDGSGGVPGRARAGRQRERGAADGEVVEELLLRYRGAELGNLLPGVEAAPSFVAETLRVTVDGLEQGGTFGPPPAGVEAEYLFRRRGDALWTSVDSELVELLKLGPEHFLERRLVDVEELRLGSVTLRRGGRMTRFDRDSRTGGWTRAGEDSESFAFGVLVDRLRSVKALDFDLDAQAESGAEVPETIDVELELLAEPGPRGEAAGTVAYSLAPTEGGDLFVRGEQRARLTGGLWSALDKLFD
jgi:hypothetical protein